MIDTRDDLLPRGRREKHQAGIDGQVSGLAADLPHHYDGAGAALALRAAFLRAGPTALAQEVQQRGLGSPLRANGPAIDNQVECHIRDWYSEIVHRPAESHLSQRRRVAEKILN